MASDLLAWIAAKVEEFGSREPIQGVDTCSSALNDNNTFRATEYPTKLAEKGALEGHYSTLQTKLRLSGRPGYQPSEGKLISDIQAAWASVGNADVEHQGFLVAELNRNRLADNKALSFNNKADAHEAWTAGKDTEMATDDYSAANLAGVVALKKKHEAFQSDLAAHELRVHSIASLANELDGLNYVHTDPVQDRYATIYENWQALVSLSQERQAALDAAEAAAERLDGLCLQYGKEAPPFSNVLDVTKERLTDTYIADTPADVGEIRASLAEVAAEMPSHKEEFDSLADIQQQIGSNVNPYSPHVFDTLSAKWQELQTLVVSRGEQLDAEAANQDGRETLRVSFAEQANAAESWLQATDAELKELVDNSSFDSIEEQISELELRGTDIAGFRPTVESLEALHAQAQEGLIFSNQHTNVTMESVRGMWLTMGNNITRQVTVLNNQILARDASNCTEEQLEEYKASFDHFDKDGSGFLERHEFRACLLSLGQDMPATVAEGEADPEFERVMGIVDPNGDGKISYDEFISFKSQENADAESSGELLEAFQLLAGDKEYVMTADLERELAPELFEYCTANMIPYEGGPGGALDYASFAAALYGESDL